MNIHNWKIFDKKGSFLNWSTIPYLELFFESPTGTGAEGYLVLNYDNSLSPVITKGGYFYDVADTSIYYSYAFNPDGKGLLSATLQLEDVSIFNPELTHTKTIKGLSSIATPDVSLFYPTTTYTAAIFLDPVSQGLIETEHLYIFEKITENDYIRPYDATNSTLQFEFVGNDTQIAFFEIDEFNQEISWHDTLIVEADQSIANVPLVLNIGFRSDTEGVFERMLKVYHVIDDIKYLIAEIAVNAEAIGEDERFRDLIENFGLFDPKNIPHLFKESDINEALPDWDLLNYKSKHIILEHDKIMPFIGTYKALINAVKWLGYDDVYFREWFLNVKENTKLSYIVPFDAKDRYETVLQLNFEQRKSIKKLNQLSLHYCINRETGSSDVWGLPETTNCYNYSMREVYIKLMALKHWLEQNIIGVNCRIVDITGEGVYFERVKNLIYSTGTIGQYYNISQWLTPYALNEVSELAFGDASILLGIRDIHTPTIADMNLRFIDLASRAWAGGTYYSLNDSTYLSNPDNFLLIGPTFEYPIKDLLEICWRASTEKIDAGALGETLVTNPLFVYDNKLRYYDPLDSSSIFYDASTNLSIFLEKAYLRDPSSNDWVNSIQYSIYPDPDSNYNYVLESSTGSKVYFDGYVNFLPNIGEEPILQYTVHDDYDVPLLTFKDFKYTDVSGTTETLENMYILDILDGKISMDAGVPNPVSSSDNLSMHLNFHYDVEALEQTITVNPVYTSPRFPLFQINPTNYYNGDPSNFSGGNAPNIYDVDNSTYQLHVNHTGTYRIELFGWDGGNILFSNLMRNNYPVITKSPNLCLYTNSHVEDSSIWDSSRVLDFINQNEDPIYDKNIRLYGLKLNKDENDEYYIEVPSITYFQEFPQQGTLNKFFNLVERVKKINGSTLSLNARYYDFSGGLNSVQLIQVHRGSNEITFEGTFAASGNNTTINVTGTPPVKDSEYDVYVLNNTIYPVSDVSNNNGVLVATIPNPVFKVNQVVSMLVTDTSMGRTWGASYRVTGVDNNTYTFDAEFPETFIEDPIYDINCKYGFSAFSMMVMETDYAYEESNTFKIYLKNTNCQELYVDNTFALMNMPFDQERLNNAWYDVNLNVHDSSFYCQGKLLSTDTSTLVLINGQYDSSGYMPEQRNIYSARFHRVGQVPEITGELERGNIDYNLDPLYFKVYNDGVPIIFNENDLFSIGVESYDKFGNLAKSEYCFVDTRK